MSNAASPEDMSTFLEVMNGKPSAPPAEPKPAAPAPAPAQPTPAAAPTQLGPVVVGNGVLPPLEPGRTMSVTDPGNRPSQPAVAPTFSTAVNATPAPSIDSLFKPQQPQQPQQVQQLAPPSQPAGPAPQIQHPEYDDMGPGPGEVVGEYDPLMIDEPVDEEVAVVPQAGGLVVSNTPAAVAIEKTGMVDHLPTLPGIEFKPSGTAGDDQVKWIVDVTSEVQRKIQQMKYVSGLALLSDPSQFDATIPIHLVIREVQWNRAGLFAKGPHDLCLYEAALTAHQAFMQGVEKEWLGYDRLYDEVLPKAMRAKRDFYEGKTKGEQEDRAIECDPNLRQMYVNALTAKSIAKALEGAGETFRQFEDGLKRTITLAISEHTRSLNQRQS